MKWLFMLMLFAGSTISLSCRDNTTEVPSSPAPQPERGVFIVNEGPFGRAPGSLSFYNITKDTSLSSVVAASAGWMSPNDAKVMEGKLYVAVYGNNTIEIRDVENFRSLGSISVSAPEYIWVEDSTTAFVASANGSVSMFNPTTRQVSRTSAGVVAFPGGIVVDAGKIYVSDYGQYPNNNALLRVLDAHTMAVRGQIEVGVAPRTIVRTGGGLLFVVCEGIYPAKGKVYAISTTADRAIDSVEVGEAPSKLSVEGQALYVLHANRVMKLGVGPLVIRDSSFVRVIQTNSYPLLYSLQVDPVNGDLYVAAVSASDGAGSVRVYTAQGVVKRAPFAVGAWPGSFAFKESLRD